MAKSFFKFPGSAPAKPPAPPAVTKPPSKNQRPTQALPGEEAASLRPPADAQRLGRPGGGDPKLDAEINRRLALSREGAAKLDRGSIGMEGLGAMDSSDMLRVLSEQTGLRVVKLDDFARPSNEIIRLLTAEQAKRLNSVPIGRNAEGILIVAVADPNNTMVTDDLHTILGCEIEEVIAAPEDIRERIDQYYGLGDETLDDIVAKVDVIEGTTNAQSVTSKEIDLSDMDALVNAAPIIRLVNVLLIKAIKERASDIHIEPFQNLIRIRYRVDGVLREIPSPHKSMLLGLVSRLKVLANIDIAECRLPQDGRIKLALEGREIDLRVSTMPTAHGESVVMRVLDKNMMMIGISQIGMSDEMLARFMKHLAKPNGIILVTGPTGCGKTTTLYAALAEIKDPGDKLITVEDPVEYELAGLIQVNVNEAVGLTFARCLRSILRQDPDTVLVGEIRDIETARISVQASLTGHLVFSTLHTNSAAATITRLIDMGIEPFLITSSIQAIIGQRLVRTICPSCKVIYRPKPDDMEEFGLTPEDLRGKVFYHGEGCPECGHTGYRGRLGLFELLEITDEIRDLVLDRAGFDEIQEVAQRNGMITMRKDGFLKICLGLTTFEEVARETPRDIVSGTYDKDGNGDSDSGVAPKDGPPPAPSDQADQPQMNPDETALVNEAAAKVLERITQA